MIRYATRRANQRGLHNVAVRRQGRRDVPRALTSPRRASPRSTSTIPSPTTTLARRIAACITPRFLADVHRASQPAAGLFVIQTDNPDYWEYMTRVFPTSSTCTSRPSPWPDAPEGRTRREIIARQRGLAIFRGLGMRRDDLDRHAALELAGSLPEPSFRSSRPLVRARSLGREPR